MDDSNLSESRLNLQLSNEEMLRNSTFNSNAGQIFIFTTVDKVKLSLIKHRSTIKIKNEWITPLGISISLLAALVTANFKDFLGLSHDIIESFFIFSLDLSSIWFFISLCRALCFLIKYRGRDDTDLIIDDLKGNTTNYIDS